MGLNEQIMQEIENQNVLNNNLAGTVTLQQIETQNVHNEIHIHTEKQPEAEQPEVRFCHKVVIIPEYTKEDFLRKAWITLASEDAPIDVFTENFSEVSEIEHQVMVESVSADVSYEASVGYDREEPYLDYETYYENEPYIAYEKQYNNTANRWEERQVTKYKKVAKQRQVTKYKRVTDWSPINGTHSTKSVVVVENLPGVYLDEYAFVSSLTGLNLDSNTRAASEEEAENMNITDKTRETANYEHASTICRSVENSLRGDHHRDLSTDITDTYGWNTILYNTFEYSVSICYKGQTYKKHAFPFGPMNIEGDEITNTDSLDTITERMKQESEEKNTKREKAVEENVMKATGMISYLTIALLLVSIIISFFVHVTALVVIAFILAVGAFVFNTIKVIKEEKDERGRAAEEIEAETRKTDEEIFDYEVNYKVKQRNALDQKLASLGLKPVTANELGG
ncbi:MAG: hypothetical protein IKG97_01505 [Lachnospiraceae bacterium]|nr:hypothetical protein [Lachnospiraceae bacterium]